MRFCISLSLSLSLFLSLSPSLPSKLSSLTLSPFPSPSLPFHLSLFLSFLSFHSDEDGDRKISKEELDKYLNSLDEETYNALTNSLRNFRDDARTEAIQRVFESLDVDGDGEVSKPEVLFWLQNEESWVRYFAAEGGGNEEKKREEVYNRIDKDANGNITLSEMSDFFKDWTLRDLRSFSQDQMYYKALREYSRNPSEEGKKKLKEMKNDRMWGDRETRRERRASKREKIDLDA